jgi:hypothetical protein
LHFDGISINRFILMKRSGGVAFCTAVALWCGFIATTGVGEVKTFTIDETQSSLTIGGSFSGIQLMQQGPGSLTTRYTGTIIADITGSTIQFTGGSMIVGENSGTWQPAPGGVAGSAPANYGGQVANFFVSGKAALRNILLDVTSDALTITGGTFMAQQLLFSFPSNAMSVVDYSYSGFLGSGSGSRSLAGTSTNNVIMTGSVSNIGAEIVLTIPADLLGYATVISTNDLQYRLQGHLVARASAAAPLEISSFAVTPGQLTFTITTVIGHSYTILGSVDLIDWSTTIDQFIAIESPTTRIVPLPPMPMQYFRIRED